jgi:capsular polysaccharide biosynthesis protein
LIEKRWSTNFAKYVFVLSNPSKYFDKVVKEFFSELKYMVMPRHETWQFNHIIVPSLSNHNDGITTPHLAPWLRSMRNIIKIIPETKKKIFISREDAKNRNIVNQNELLMALQGWKTITLENLSIKEQVKTFAEATHIVAPHGAGLINLLWCDPKTKVYELTHRDFLEKKVYPTLSKHLGLEHQIVLCDTVKIKEAKSKNKKIKDMVDLKIDIAELIEILN